MIGPLDALPVWAIALVIFTLRICDVTLGTFRTISVVHGRVRLAVLLGFFEIAIWVTAISQVVVKLGEVPLLLLPYSAGYATGNALGIWLERQLAIGAVVIRIITTTDHASAIAGRLESLGHLLTRFSGDSPGGPRSLLYGMCQRRDLPMVIAEARAVDSGAFYAIDRFAETSAAATTVNPTGWRALLKKK